MFYIICNLEKFLAASYPLLAMSCNVVGLLSDLGKALQNFICAMTIQKDFL